MDNQSTQPVASTPDASNDKLMAVLAYIIFFIPLLTSRDSKFVMFHTNQGTWLFIIGLIGNVVSGILAPIGIGCLLYPIVWIFVLVYAILGIVNASKMVEKSLPGFASLPVLVK